METWSSEGAILSVDWASVRRLRSESTAYLTGRPIDGHAVLTTGTLIRGFHGQQSSCCCAAISLRFSDAVCRCWVRLMPNVLTSLQFPVTHLSVDKADDAPANELFTHFFVGRAFVQSELAQVLPFG